MSLHMSCAFQIQSTGKSQTSDLGSPSCVSKEEVVRSFEHIRADLTKLSYTCTLIIPYTTHIHLVYPQRRRRGHFRGTVEISTKLNHAMGSEGIKLHKRNQLN